MEVGFNYRLDEVRCALLASRLSRLEGDIAARRELVLRYRRSLREVRDVVLPYEDEDIERSSCYVMPIMLEEAARRPDVRRALDEQGVQTSILYPAVHELSAFRRRFPDVSLPATEEASRREITLPLYPHMGEKAVDRVVSAIISALRS